MVCLTLTKIIKKTLAETVAFQEKTMQRFEPSKKRTT
jgi:hypothetical protein